jgi:adenylosuccinate lyase
MGTESGHHEAGVLYDNPLVERYASREMAERWGPLRKYRTWRRLWLWLAEAQAELGLRADDGVTPRIRPEQLAALREHLDDVDLERAAAYEQRFRHDVMAHIHTFQDAAPQAGDILHLGATSCYVTDNADLILMRESLEQLCRQLAAVMAALADFAQRWKETPTLGFTHFQPAQLTTVGKRACLWLYDLLLDLQELERRQEELPFRGAKGTTGTQASFLTLFQGDHEKVRQLDRLVAAKAGFSRVVPVCGQTYSRKIDTQVLEALGGLGQSLHKWGTDLRLLAHRQEIEEPFEAEQVGSSAMAYKRNPMRAERLCSLARFLMNLPAMASQTAAVQWLERTLDDSAIRRLYLPQAFLAADACLRLALHLARRLIVQPQVIARNVQEQLPYMITESLMMAAVQGGANRQQVHEVVRQHSLAVAERIKAGQGNSRELLERLRQEPVFQRLDWERWGNLGAEAFIGRAPQQVDEFLAEHVHPRLQRYRDRPPPEAELRV